MQPTQTKRVNTMDNVSRNKVFGRSVIIRKRAIKKKPLGYTKGKCFHQFDNGFYTLYVERSVPAKAIGFGKITDK